MGKIEEMEGDVEELAEIFNDDSDESQIRDDSGEPELEEVEGGIFDEDIASDVVSDFDIGTTMLTSAAPVESWAGQNLEETLSREHVQKDWGDEEEFVGSEVYKPSDDSSSDVYGVNGSDAYGTGDRGGGAYGGTGGSDAYNSGKDGGEGAYSTAPGRSGDMKSYDQMKDNRRSGRSMLEIAGFEDKGKQKNRELRTDIRKYVGKEAA